MITSTPINQPNHNLTPNDLTQEQDMLLLAGSKVSFREIYNQEIDLPLYRNKYYPATDVDNLFVLINGIFTSVSEQSYRSDKALTAAREEATAAQVAQEKAEQANQLAQNKLTQATASKASLQEQLATSVNQQASLVNAQEADTTVKDLSQKLADKEAAYTRLLQSSAIKLRAQQKLVDQVQNENEQLKSQIAKTAQAKADQPASSTVLRNKLDMLQYKYDNLKTLSTQRIQALQSENNKEI